MTQTEHLDHLDRRGDAHGVAELVSRGMRV